MRARAKAPTTADRLAAAFDDHRAGRHAEAAEVYEAVIAEEPENADALNLLASAKRSSGDVAGALPLAQRAAAAAPSRQDIRFNLGNALFAAGETDAAVDAYVTALRLGPGTAEIEANLGIALARQGDHAAAVDAYRRALELDPGHRVAAHNLGNALSETGRAEEATAQLRRVAAAHPDLVEARYNLALALLRRGDFAGGFAAYEYRWKTPDFAAPPRHTGLPAWDGKPFHGKRLVVHAEQGLGDTLQFVRLVPLVASLGGPVTLEVPGALTRLLKGFPGTDRIVGHEGGIGTVDLQVPLLSLPLRLGLSLGGVPARVPYLAAEPERVAFWRKRLKPDSRPIVALCWRGNPNSPADRGRSLGSGAALITLSWLPGIRLVSVMKQAAPEIEPHDGPTGWRVAGLDFTVEHPGPDFDAGADGFVDAAAVLTIADQAVTTDTSVAHLAGALARPTQLLLKAVPDWRWLTGRASTPWYPTMRLHRQESAGDFGPAIEAAARAVGKAFRAFPDRMASSDR
jgi:Flp pilus assembly protein TadD